MVAFNISQKVFKKAVFLTIIVSVPESAHLFLVQTWDQCCLLDAVV